VELNKREKRVRWFEESNSEVSEWVAVVERREMSE